MQDYYICEECGKPTSESNINKIHKRESVFDGLLYCNVCFPSITAEKLKEKLESTTKPIKLKPKPKKVRKKNKNM